MVNECDASVGGTGSGILEELLKYNLKGKCHEMLDAPCLNIFVPVAVAGDAYAEFVAVGSANANAAVDADVGSCYFMNKC
jgi:hypothetical protein